MTALPWVTMSDLRLNPLVYMLHMVPVSNVFYLLEPQVAHCDPRQRSHRSSYVLRARAARLTYGGSRSTRRPTRDK